MSSPEARPTDPAAKTRGNLDETFVPTNPEETLPVSSSADSEETSATPKADSQPAPQKSAAGGQSPSGKKVTQLGDFKLVKKLGQGGMGTVYLARQISLDRKVALKTLSKELAKNKNAVERFLREARSMAKLTHPNIVQVYAADSAHGFHFAALEFIDGQSMQDVMDAKKKLSLGDAVHVVLVTADALRHAHEQSMVHRDIKPDNILVTKSGVVKVSDFGLAKALDEDLSVTQSGTGLGTPLYMSPEQARNAKHVDRRSDVYALGVTLYHFLTGDVPFKGESTLEVIMAKEQGKFMSARRLNGEIPERLDLMIDKMMAKDMKHRYDNCGEIIRDLEALGIASPSLSFADVTAGSAPILRTGASTGQQTRPGDLPRAPTAVTGAPKERKTSEQHKQDALTAEKKWFVAYTSKDGKHHMKQMTTEQVVAGLRSGAFDLKTKAKRDAKGSLLPLAQYPEFVKDVEKAALRQRAAAKDSKFQQMFDEVDRYEKKKRLYRFFRRITDSALGWFGLVLWIAVIAGVGVGLYYGIPLLGKFIAEYFGVN